MINTKFNQSNAHIRRARRAFTLLEIIVVVTIIALLATMVAPRVWRYIGSSKQNVAKAEVSALAKTVQLYCTDNGMSVPPAEMDLAVLLDGSDPYLSKPDDLLDPWGNPYVYDVPGRGAMPFALYSLGADGQPGGEGNDADVGFLPAE